MNKNILVIYYSRSGNTRKVAEEIAQKLHCDLEEIQPRVSYSKTFWGYQRALIHASFKKKPEIRMVQSLLEDYDLIIVGSPVWGSSLSAPIRSFFDRNKDELRNVAFFLTQGGEFGRKKVFSQMKELCHKTPLATLAVTERDVRSGKFKEQVLEFITKLNLERPEATAEIPRSLEL